jgi:hypothetical protein
MLGQIGKSALMTARFFYGNFQSAGGFSPMRFKIRQERRQQADQGQERADLIDKTDARHVSQLTQGRSTDTAHPESKTEKQS